MTDHLLGHLARRFTVSEENLATEALTWLLRAPAASNALSSIARAAGADLPDGLHYVGQVGNPETGRPDVVGLDVHRAERLLIEAKFGAALTDQQPGGYLNRLPADAPGLLLVVAPDARKSSLWTELMKAVPQLAANAPSPSLQHDQAVLRVLVQGSKVLALTSWRHLVTQVLEALKAAGDTRLAQDAEQLLAFTEVMDSQAYEPVRPGHYSMDEGRRVQQLEELIDGSHRLAKKSKVLEHEGRSSHGRIFYGWYLRSRATRKALWFGFHPRLWARHGLSPLWMQVKVGPSWSRQRLAQALSPLQGPGEVGVFEEGDNFHIPLVLPAYMTRDQTVADLLRQLESVVGLIDAAVPAGEAPQPDAIPGPELDDAEA